jgi:hypothetical protein
MMQSEHLSGVHTETLFMEEIKVEKLAVWSMIVLLLLVLAVMWVISLGG